MSDLASMLREQMSNTLNSQLESAVQAGDIAAAKKATEGLTALATSTAAGKPTGPAYGLQDVRKVLREKAPWFGTDPRKSAKAIELGKAMEFDAFPSAEKFAEALINATEAEMNPGGNSRVENDDDEGDDDDDLTGEEGDDEEDEEDEEAEAEARRQRRAARKKARKNGTVEPELNAGRRNAGKTVGPWTKLSDAPKDVAKRIQDQTAKFARTATKEQKEKFTRDALASAYRMHQTAKGKK